jgi:glycosyltransferase involved in cell wall biosynthesis
MVRVAAALQKDLHTIIFLPSRNSERFQQFCLEHHVDYRTTRLTPLSKDLLTALNFFVFFLWETIQLMVLLKRANIQLVHASGGSWQYKAVLASWLLGVPCVWHLNDTKMPALIRFTFKYAQHLAQGWIFASNASHDYYKNLITPGRPTAIIPSTVSTDAFNPDIKVNTDPCLGKKGLFIGTVANISPVKGLETLIRACAALAEIGHTPQVVIAGDVSTRQSRYHKHLVNLANDLGLNNLLFMGPQSDVRPILKKLDIYVCSSISESSPISVWEGMAMGLPIVSTDVGDVSCYVDDEKEGYIVPVGDHLAMASKLEYLLENPAKREQMGLAARKSAQNFHPDKISLLTLGIYKNVCKEAD